MRQCDLGRGYGIVVIIFYFGKDDGYSGIYSNMQTLLWVLLFDFLYMCYALITSKPLPPGGLVKKKKKKSQKVLQCLWENAKLPVTC